jgi:rubrerythrin
MLDKFAGSQSPEVGKGLDVAERIERESIARYESLQAAAGASGSAKPLFAFLAGEERKHLAAVLSLKSRAGQGASGWAEAERIASPDIFSGFGPRRVKEVPMQENVLSAAIGAERESEGFYGKMAEAAGGAEAREFFRKMAGFERSHEELLSALASLSDVKIEGAGYPGEF